MPDKPERPEKPKPGGFCPYAREAAIIAGIPPAKAMVACKKNCMKFGHYYPDGKIEQAVGCTRKG